MKYTYLLIASLFFASCNNSKTNETVFPTQVAQSCIAATIKNQFVVGWEDGRYSIETAESEDSFRRNFVDKNLDKIKHVDRDIKIKIQPYSNESLVDEDAASNQWHVDQIHARAVWNQGYQGENIIVGVIDGMVDTTHNQIRNNIAFSQQFNSQINDPEKNIHGTHVAGIIAADPQLGPASGIAPKAKIAAGQFINNEGAGSVGEAILAMNTVVNFGAKIINLSWGGAPCVDNLREAMSDLSGRGILLITAAGNEATNSDIRPTYPANFLAFNQLNIAATGFNDLLTSFSNRGYKSVHVAAPGQTIYSTTPNNTIQAMDGTSMSAPVVAGAAALLMSAVPEANAQQVKQALMKTVDIPGQYLQTQTGGRVNVEKALTELKRLVLK